MYNRNPEDVLIEKEMMGIMAEVYTEDELDILMGKQTTKNVAKKLGITTNWIRNQIRNKKIKILRGLKND